jgi:hypothetical protein
MNDNFLYEFREQPDPKFACRLYNHITTIHESKLLLPRKIAGLNRIWIGIIILLISACSVITASPTAREEIIRIFHEIAGLTYQEVDQTVQRSPEQQSPFTLSSTRLTEAMEKLPFTFNLPSVIPEGFKLDENVKLFFAGDETSDVSKAFGLRIAWRMWFDANSFANIDLIVYQYREEFDPLYIGIESLEEITIGGEPAALIRGFWDSSTRQWNFESSYIAIRWRRKDIVNYLGAHELVVSLEELINMAESMK